MKLEKVTISNYRSIANESITIQRINNSSTYCLLGINESGKTSFLKGIALFDLDKIEYPQDFFDESQPVEITFDYKVSLDDNKNLINSLIKNLFPKDLVSVVEISNVAVKVQFNPIADGAKVIKEVLSLKRKMIPGYRLDGKTPVKLEKGDNSTEELDIQKFFDENLPKHFWSISHHVIFWESNDKYLINDEIDLMAFAVNALEISLPLSNCFLLAGIKIDDIEKAVSKLTKPAPIRNLESLLSESVTKHIRTVWPNHPISIRFEINNNKISLLIEDEGVKYKAKTTSQRSDGFRQFISFLLTLSAENLNKELTNTILLIDEPETHLHPQAQINLKDELIKITSNSNNNIVFYATHSNYLIDKKDLDRNIIVSKSKNEKTTLETIAKLDSSYSEVNYTIFNIPTVDYHNELYGYLEDIFNEKLEKLTKDKIWHNKKSKKDESVSLSKYIRNAIHHPENTSNKSYSEIQLKKSIDILRKLKYK